MEVTWIGFGGGAGACGFGFGLGKCADEEDWEFDGDGEAVRAGGAENIDRWEDFGGEVEGCRDA